MTVEIAPLQQRHARRALAPQVITALFLIGVAAVLVALNEKVRAGEAWLASLWLNQVVSGGVVSSGTGFMVQHTVDGAIIFRITAECTVLVLIVPMLLFGAILSLHRGTSLARALTATGVGVLLLVLVNQIRFGIIAAATIWWGLDPGYTISHSMVASIAGILGFAAAVILALRVVGRERKPLGGAPV